MDRLVTSLKQKYNLDDRVENVMRKYDRAKFCKICPNIYRDTAHKINNQTKQTMSAPHMHAIALQILSNAVMQFNGNFNALDIGCGTGYMVAAMADIIRVGNRRKVIGIDIYRSLVNLTIRNIGKFDHLQKEYLKGNIKVICGDGWRGYSALEPFHFIHIGAMADEFPEELFRQLAVGGVMALPINGKYMIIKKIKKNGKVEKEMTELTKVRFVPFIKPKERTCL